MLSINTNLSSLIAQNSMNSATSLLNQAVERMTTGCKINHSKDNAANYSISTNMQTKIQSYDVAADNVAMGMDLVTTASDIISNMQDKANRLQSLCIQARNGTYGASSMAAINSEASAIMAEINRLYSTAEYNNISLFNRKAYEIADHLPQAGASGFIEEPVTTYSMRSGSTYNGKFCTNPETYSASEVAAMTRVKDVSTFEEYETYSIYTVEELEKLADYVNAGNDTSNVEFVLGADIDLSSIANWTPVGYDYDHSFKGTFDGNGHVIKNLTINSPTEDYQGLFGYAELGSEIKNIGIVNCNVKGSSYVGGLVGQNWGNTNNSYTTGNVVGGCQVGGLAGAVENNISNSYSTGNVTGTNCVGGLVGEGGGVISNSYATGNVTGNDYVGGLVGYTHFNVSNSYATGGVNGTDYIGGLAGCAENNISNSYAIGNVTGTEYVGGLVGFANGDNTTNVYSTGKVKGNEKVGGLFGFADGMGNPITITDSASYSEVVGNNKAGLIGGYIDAYGELQLNNVSVRNSGIPTIGYYYDADVGVEDPVKAQSYNTIVATIQASPVSTTLLVGINGDSSCQIGFDTNFSFDLSAIGSDISSDSALACINDFLTLLSEKSTLLGAVENRLQSSLESIEVNIENLTSSLSTIRDADIAEVSSQYIQQQILQQASATLMATANQAPSIALQLI